MPAVFDLGTLEQIPAGEGRVFTVGQRRVAVFHTRDGSAYATQAECPHRQGPLADGLTGGTTIVCPLHEWRFDLRTGQTEHGACGIAVYPLDLDRDGRIVVTIP